MKKYSTISGYIFVFLIFITGVSALIIEIKEPFLIYLVLFFSGSILINIIFDIMNIFKKKKFDIREKHYGSNKTKR